MSGAARSSVSGRAAKMAFSSPTMGGSASSATITDAFMELDPPCRHGKVLFQQQPSHLQSYWWGRGASNPQVTEVTAVFKTAAFTNFATSPLVVVLG